MLNCCVDLEEVKTKGVTIGTVACLAKCQGLAVDAVYGSNSTVAEFRRVVKRTCTAPSATTTQPTSFLVVSYTRKVIGQTGSGHFSPIGAYDEASDHVLILDTARFKYGPHWVSLPLMFEALLPIDPATGKSRGYMVLGYDGSEGRNGGNGGNDGGVERGGAGNETHLAQLPLSVIFGSKKSKDYVRREYKQYLRSLSNSSGEEGDDDDDHVASIITLASVIAFWTEDYTDTKRVWELVEPQLQPVDTGAIRMLESVRRLIQHLIRIDDGASSIPREVLSTGSGAAVVGTCCNSHAQNNERKLEISPAEVLYVVYLASIPLDARRGIVYDRGVCREDEARSMIEVDDATREQLLAEAALISYAIETCDFDL